VADDEGDVMQLLHELTGLEDLKIRLEQELSRIKTVSYQFEENRTADKAKISKQIDPKKIS
jgi:hypothetical protein